MGDGRGGEPRLRVRFPKAQTPSGPQSETIGGLRTRELVALDARGFFPADRFHKSLVDVAWSHFPRRRSKCVPTARKNSGYCSQVNIRNTQCQTKNCPREPAVDRVREGGGIRRVRKCSHAEGGVILRQETPWALRAGWMTRWVACG